MSLETISFSIGFVFFVGIFTVLLFAIRFFANFIWLPFILHIIDRWGSHPPTIIRVFEESDDYFLESGGGREELIKYKHQQHFIVKLYCYVVSYLTNKFF